MGPAEGDTAMICSKYELQALNGKDKYTLLHNCHLYHQYREKSAKGGKKLQNIIRNLMFSILHKATRRAAG